VPPNEVERPPTHRLKCPTVADPGTTTEPLTLDLVQLQYILDRQKVRFKAHFASF
jgi:hypothetical protein